MPITFPPTAEAFLALHWDGFVPMDVDKMAKRAGIRIETVRFEDDTVCDQLWDGEVPVIRIGHDQTGTRRTFAIAHSIGHFCLGHMGTAANPKTPE